MSPEDPKNFLKAPEVIILIRNTGGKFKVWDPLVGAKNAFPKIRMAQIESPELKKLSAYCVGKVSVLLHTSLYRVLKLMFPTDVGNIVIDNQITTDIVTGSLGQYIEILTP